MNSQIGEIDSIYIDEAYREYGLGKLLVNNAIDWLIEKGTTEQKLLVGVGNERVFDFYKQFDFLPLHIVLQRIEKTELGILKSHILIDLKIGKFDHADAGQMNIYLNYYKDNEMSDGDNPPIGLILCGSKGEALAKYATSGMDNQLFVSKYLVQLPDKKVLENFIRKEIGE